MGSGGVAIAALPTVICLKVPFSDGLGGGVHFSKDRIDRPGNRPLYGMVAENHNDYWGNIISGVELVSLSQEHGVMHCTDDFLDRLHVGDIVTVLPVHSCMTADLMKIYHMNDGKTAAHI